MEKTDIPHYIIFSLEPVSPKKPFHPIPAKHLLSANAIPHTPALFPLSDQGSWEGHNVSVSQDA